MNSLFNRTNLYSVILVLAAFTFHWCQYDVTELAPEPDASFTVTPVSSGQVNKYL